MIKTSLFLQSLLKIEHNINKIIKETDKKRQDIKIIGVTKKQPIECWSLALQNNIKIIGESTVQETEKKIQTFNKREEIELHLIGHLQTNKVKKAVLLFDIIQTVDSIKLLEKIDQEAKQKNKCQHIYLQVNTGKDPNKFGFTTESIIDAAKKTTKLKNIYLNGVMTIPPAHLSYKKIKSIYKETRQIRDYIKNRIEKNCINLSMGMSSDYKIAVEEGATHIRIGKELFGNRIK